MSSTPELYDWQVNSACDIRDALLKYRVAADGSDTGTGKTYKVVADAEVRGHTLYVVCPKSMVAEWRRVAALFGVSAYVCNYEKVRTGKTLFGKWQVKGKIFEWTIPANVVLVFDEAHRCGGMQTQTSLLLIAAKRQGVPLILLSATLIGSPLKAYAIGYALGLHNLVNFWKWARSKGVVEGFFGPEWAPHKLTPPRTEEEIMQEIRVALGDKFTRIRKADVPGFPEIQNIPTFADTDEMPDLESDYSVEARRTVELLKVPGLVEKTKELVDEEGMSVAIFVNFRATLKALQDEFPKAVSVYGGQTASERTAAINSFQTNEVHVILLMSQAGGTGISLHDLHGRPRAALVCPGYDAKEFLQILGRIHRAGSLSRAINYIVFASGVPVERRIRRALEDNLANLTALNDYDLGKPDAGASETTSGGAAENAVTAHSDEHHGDQGLEHEPQPSPKTEVGPLHQLPSGPQSTVKRAPIIASKPADVIDVTATVINTPAETTTPGHHVERKHARSSPSKLKNLEICPSYEGDNDGPVHPVTLRGTAMHEALETGNDNKLDPLNTEGVIPGGSVEHELVAMCREFQDQEKVPGEIVQLEAHLKTHDQDVQGFVDRRVILPPDANGRRKARIRDYKMGFNLVDLPNINPQAIAYTLATFLEYPDVDEINFAFLIPRLDAVLEHTFTRADIPEMKLRISTIAERVRKLSGKEFNVNYENCLYCGRKATCTAMHAKMLPLANGIAPEDRLPLPVSFDLDTITDPQQIAFVLNLANMAETFAAQAKSFGLRYRLELGQEVPGYDLIERQAKREIVNPVAAFEVAKEFGVTETEYLSAARVSVTALDKMVRDHAQHGDKEGAADRFTDRLSDENAMSRGAPFHVLQRSRKKPKVLPAAA